jgi:hypothetical protein
MDEPKKLPSNKQSGLPMNGPAASVQQEFTARMTMQEAIAAVGKMLNAYPNARDGVRDGYMGIIAALLCQYPRSIAMRCANPINGVCRTTKFLPTVAEVVEWCETNTVTIRTFAEFQSNSRKQFAEQDQREEADEAEPLEYRRKVAERIRRELAEAFAEGRGLIDNVFVPTFAPQYADMVGRGGKPGVSLEDKTRAGVWVPREWFETGAKAKSSWSRFSADELLKKYPSRP